MGPTRVRRDYNVFVFVGFICTWPLHARLLPFVYLSCKTNRHARQLDDGCVEPTLSPTAAASGV